MMQGVAADMAGLEVRGITADSRAVRPGYLFAALPGRSADGTAFIADAVARGAAAVLARTGTHWPQGVPPRPLLQDNEPRRRLALLAARFAGAQPDIAVAVTGTNGKTSVVDFLRQIWSLAGHRAASLGTLGMIAPGLPARPGLTTPDPVALSSTLADLARHGIGRVAMEASSIGLDQYRMDGVRLAAAAFTNLTRDHLDYHGTMQAYREAKLRLFEALLAEGAPALASAQLEPETLTSLAELAQRRRLALHTVGESGNLIRLLRAEPVADGQILEVAHTGRRHHLHVKLPGRFQADNVLLAAGLALVLGDSAALAQCEALVGVRGRMELAATLPNGAAVYVDYAHTPDALIRLLAALRPHTKGRLHLVFGAGGDRDPGKRPLMGAAAAAGADRIIVTDDNPRSEHPASIRAEILAACPDAREQGDRALAIKEAMNALAPGDVLVVAGKGHEQGQTIGSQTLAFDDAAVVRRLAGTA
jgi:UDP-N-acetylmuramoyl-L-alanyl-D-glutamate--2,6-diaminopimelate ligase